MAHIHTKGYQSHWMTQITSAMLRVLTVTSNSKEKKKKKRKKKFGIKNNYSINITKLGIKCKIRIKS